MFRTRFGQSAAVIVATTAIISGLASNGAEARVARRQIRRHAAVQPHANWCKFSDTLPMMDMSEMQMMDEMNFYPMMKHNLGANECAKVVSGLTAAKKYGMQFPTAADAIKGGFRLIAPYIPGQGAHYIGPLGINATFDPNTPNFLLFGGNGPTAPLVGLMWLVQSGQTPPAGIPGGNDHWHRHNIVCMVGGVILAEDISDAACAAMNGGNIDISGLWMLHAWIVPGYEYLPDVFRPHVPFLM